MAVTSIRGSPVALLQFKGTLCAPKSCSASSRGRDAAENWWLLRELKGRVWTSGSKQIAARPLHEQVWGWDKAAAQLRLGSRTPHLANCPHSLWNCPFAARWRQLVPLMHAVCPRQAKAEAVYDMEAAKRCARLPHHCWRAASLPREGSCTPSLQAGSLWSRLQALRAHKHPPNKHP